VSARGDRQEVMGIKERKERQKQEIRRLVLDTARKLFLEEGFEKVTIRHIAERIEYSPATLYLYFKDKDEILYELHTEGLNELYKRQQQVMKIKDPFKRLQKHAEAYLQFAVENKEYYDLMFIMRSPFKCVKDVQHWETGMRSYDLLKLNVKDCMEAGRIPHNGLDAAAFSFWALMHGIASLIIRERTIMFPDEVVPAIVKGASEYILGAMSAATKR
ncbi:MAG TPA: TetR/AcrR family transcriptional regulator, partial [Nitrospirota bacterium]